MIIRIRKCKKCKRLITRASKSGLCVSCCKKGRKLSQIHKDKISARSKIFGFQKGHKTNVGKHPWNLGKHYSWSREMRLKHRGASYYFPKGDKHPLWKGTTLLSDTIRSTFEYRLWRSDVFTRDNYTCQDCGIHGGYLEAHHIKEFYKIMTENRITTVKEALECTELWDINNGRSLCSDCHNTTKPGRQKS